MFTLFSGLWKYYTQKEEFNVIILGLDNAGKTTLLEKIKSIYLKILGLSPDKIAPTVGLNIGKVDIGAHRLNFWDLGGQRELQRIWQKYYPECHSIVFVVDSTDKDRIEEVKKTFENVITDHSVEGVPVLMLANKQDVEGSLRIHEIKEIFNPIALKLGARDSKVLSISALQGEGVKEAVEWLQVRMQRNSANRPPVFRK